MLSLEKVLADSVRRGLGDGRRGGGGGGQFLLRRGRGRGGGGGRVLQVVAVLLQLGREVVAVDLQFLRFFVTGIGGQGGVASISYVVTYAQFLGFFYCCPPRTSDPTPNYGDGANLSHICNCNSVLDSAYRCTGGGASWPKLLLPLLPVVAVAAAAAARGGAGQQQQLLPRSFHPLPAPRRPPPSGRSDGFPPEPS